MLSASCEFVISDGSDCRDRDVSNQHAFLGGGFVLVDSFCS